VNKSELIHVFLLTPDLVRQIFRKDKDKKGFRWNINKPQDLDKLKSFQAVSYACLTEGKRRIVLDSAG